MIKRIAILLFLYSITATAVAQDVLPNFSVTTRGSNKIIISWTNNYPFPVSQISIQRSFDSARNFKTILTVPDPHVPQNGFVDTKAPNEYMFYRLFIVLDTSGKYIFTAPKKAFWDTLTKQTAEPAPVAPIVITPPEPGKKAAPVPTPPVARLLTIKRRDSIVAQIPEKDFRKFRDSIMYKTKDTLTAKNTDTFLIRPFMAKPPMPPKEIVVASKYIFVEKDGNVIIRLPVSDHQYLIKFFEEDGSALFEIKQVKGPALIIDKVNFIHAGTFRFELYEDGKIKEKNKFTIPKDF